MTPSLLLVLLAASPSPECQKIRDVHALAVQAGLDDASLRALEGRHCRSGPDAPAPPPPAPPPPPPEARPPHHERPSRLAPPPGATEDCRTLFTMARLARMQGEGAEALRTIESERDVTCALRTDRGRFSWPSGITARSSSGAWSWPNGITARTSSGAYSYPSGITARSSSGAWSWPSGITALSSSGRWSRPDGTSVDEPGLLAQACRARAEGCDGVLRELASLSPEDRALTILELSWASPGR